MRATLDRRIQNVGQLIALRSQGVQLAIQAVLVLPLFDAGLERRDPVPSLCSLWNKHPGLLCSVILFELLQFYVSLEQVIVFCPSTALFRRVRSFRLLGRFLVRSSRVDVI